MPNQQPNGTKRPEKMSARPEGLMRDHDLFAKCAAFVHQAVPESNIVLEQDFERFMPMFNATLKAKLSEDEWVELNTAYSSKFSLQHPILILTNTLDPQGVMYPKDKRRHKLSKKIPPFFHRVKTLNEYSHKASSLMTQLFNAIQTKAGNPLDHRESAYAQMIDQVLKANELSDTEKKAKIAELKAAEQALIQRKNPNEPQTTQTTTSSSEEESSISGIIEW